MPRDTAAELELEITELGKERDAANQAANWHRGMSRSELARAEGITRQMVAVARRLRELKMIPGAGSPAGETKEAHGGPQEHQTGPVELVPPPGTAPGRGTHG